MDKQAVDTGKQQTQDGDGENRKCCCLYKVLLIDQARPMIDIEGKSHRTINLAVEHNVDLIEESFIYADDEPVDEIFRDAYHFVDDAKTVLKHQSKRRLYNEAGLDGLRIKHDCDYAEDMIDYIKIRVSLLFQKRSKASEEQEKVQVLVGGDENVDNRASTRAVTEIATGVVDDSSKRPCVLAMSDRPVESEADVVAETHLPSSTSEAPIQSPQKAEDWPSSCESTQAIVCAEQLEQVTRTATSVIAQSRSQSVSESSHVLLQSSKVLGGTEAIAETLVPIGSEDLIQSPPKAEDWPSSCESSQTMGALARQETVVEHDAVPPSQSKSTPQLPDVDPLYRTVPAPPPPSPTMDNQLSPEHSCDMVEAQLHDCSSKLCTAPPPRSPPSTQQPSSDLDASTQQQVSFSWPLRSTVAKPKYQDSAGGDSSHLDETLSSSSLVEDKIEEGEGKNTDATGAFEYSLDHAPSQSEGLPVPTAPPISEMDRESLHAEDNSQVEGAIDLSTTDSIDHIEDDIKKLKTCQQSIQIGTSSAVRTSSPAVQAGQVSSEKAAPKHAENNYEVLTIDSDSKSGDADDNDDNDSKHKKVPKRKGRKQDKGAVQCSSSGLETVRHRRQRIKAERCSKYLLNNDSFDKITNHEYRRQNDGVFFLIYWKTMRKDGWIKARKALNFNKLAVKEYLHNLSIYNLKRYNKLLAMMPELATVD